MSRRNVVRVSFEVVDGGGLRDLERASNALNNLGRAGHGATPGVAGAAEQMRQAERASNGLNSAATSASGGMSRLGNATRALQTAIAAIGLAAATKELIDFGIASVEAAERATKAQLTLQATARLTGVQLSSLNTLAADLVKKVPQLSTIAADEIVARATRFTAAAGRPEDTDRFIQAVVAAVRANGGNISDLPELLKQLAGGAAETALDKLAGGINPSEIFKRRFAEVGGTSAETLTDAQQKAAILNEIFAQASKLGDLVAPETIGQNVEILKARFVDFEVQIGKVIERNEGLKKTVELLTDLTSALGDPGVASNVENVTVGLVRTAQAFTVIGGGIAILANAFKLAITASNAFIEVLGSGIATAIKIVVGGVEIMIGKIVETLQATFGPAANILFGLGGVEGGALAGRGEAEARGALEANSANTTAQLALVTGAARDFSTIVQQTASFVGFLGEFAKFSKPGELAPETKSAVKAVTDEVVSTFSAKVATAIANGVNDALEKHRAADKLKGSVDKLNENIEKLEVFGRIEVIAGPNTTVDFVPTGGATP